MSYAFIVNINNDHEWKMNAFWGFIPLAGKQLTLPIMEFASILVSFP